MIEEPKASETDCAYLAGLMDRAATVRIVRENRRRAIYRTLLLEIGGLTYETAEWMLEKFGPGHSVSDSKGVEITYVTRRAADICVQAYPYLQRFKKHAQLVTRFASSLGPKRIPLTSENVAIRAEVDNELTALDRGGRGRR